MSSDCSCTVISTTVAGTLTSGIQDIAALLPLLGTEHCEDHVSSALTKGYLYAAASPMSLFGSLGLARAGLKTFVASSSIPMWNIVGARILSNMGFKPQGENLSLIMIDPNDRDGRYLIESRLQKLVEELHIDKSKIQGVQHKTIAWNIRMMSLSAALCVLSMVPYIFLNVKAESNLPIHTRWTLPPLRAAGGFLTTVTMQFIIQMRVTTLARRWISEYCSNETSFEESGESTGHDRNDVERNPKIIVTDSHSPLMWFLLILLLLGVLASIVGYVGCFSVVQSAKKSNGPLSWLCLEAGLSLLRMFLWGWNPTGDDAPPLQLILARDPYPPLPTCKLYDHDIEAEKTLPLARANQFLNSITFTGVVERFDHPDVTLYYTLTRNATSQAEHVLYITIFHHKERANTRVYTRRGSIEHFYATETSLPVLDPKQGLLEIKLGDEINHQDDPITSDRDIRSQLNAHYQSIMDQIHFAMGQSDQDPTYTIENKWTMAIVHTTSTPRKKGEEIQAPTADAMTSLSIRDFQYIQHGRFEKNIQSLCLARGEWIAMYMHWAIRETRERFTSQASTVMPSDVDGARARAEGKRRIFADETETWESPAQVMPVGSDQEDIESQIIDGIRRMELLLVQERQMWDEHFWMRANKFIGRDDVLEKPRLTMEWKLGFRTRLETDMRAMEARFNAAELEVKANQSDRDELTRKWHSAYDDIRKARQALAEKPTPSPAHSNLSHLENFQTEYENIARDVEAIIGWSHPTAAQREQLQQQSGIASRSTIELTHAMFWMDDTHGLTDYKLRRSKWVNLDIRRFPREFEPLEVALKTMNDVIFARFDSVDSDDDYRLVTELIRNLPSSVTTVFVYDSHRLPAIQRDTPLFIGGRALKIETFLRDNQTQLASTRRTHIFTDVHHHDTINPVQLSLLGGSKIAVSFFGPPSGNLVLKLIHSSPDADGQLGITEFHTLHTAVFPVPSSFTATDITLFPSLSESLFFFPNTRNHLIIEVRSRVYMVRDIRLQDEAGNDYNATSLDPGH